MNLKKLLGKLPGGQSAIASYAAALLLLREYDKKEVKEDFNDYVDSSWLQKEFDICLAEAKKMFEDGIAGAPTNSVGGGNIAAVGIGPQGEPPMRKSKVLKRLKRFDEYEGVK
jgi:hypothetical protein